MGKGSAGPGGSHAYPERETSGDPLEMTKGQETRYFVAGVCIIVGAVLLVTLMVLCATGVIHPAAVRP